MSEPQKVSEFPRTSNPKPGSLLYLVQDDQDMAVDLAAFLGNLPNTPTKLRGILALAGTPQVLSGSGEISSAQSVTNLNIAGTNTLTLEDGRANFQIKVVMALTVSGTGTISSGLTIGQARFTSAGQSLLLIWNGNAWCPLGGTATLTT